MFTLMNSQSGMEDSKRERVLPVSAGQSQGAYRLYPMIMRFVRLGPGKAIIVEPLEDVRLLQCDMPSPCIHSLCLPGSFLAQLQQQQEEVRRQSEAAEKQRKKAEEAELEARMQKVRRIEREIESLRHGTKTLNLHNMYNACKECRRSIVSMISGYLLPHFILTCRRGPKQCSSAWMLVMPS